MTFIITKKYNLLKFKICIPYNLAIPQFRELYAHLHKKEMQALSSIKKPKIRKWLDKLQLIHMSQCYTANGKKSTDRDGLAQTL